MTDTVASMIAEAAAALSQAGFDEPRRHGRRLLAGAMQVSAAELLMTSDHGLDGSTAEKMRGLIRRMAEGEPLSRVLGRREFWGLDLQLSPETLDPRPESETIIEAVLARVDRDAPLSVLDLGTGSGCLLLAILSELTIATGIGVDLSPGAVMTARGNAHALGLADRSRFFVGNWGAAIAHRFDVIVANPPYIVTSALGTLPAEVRGYDPRLALDGNRDGLGAYRLISAQLADLMAPRALFVTEIGIGQAAAVAAILRNHGTDVEAIDRDLCGIERCVIGRHGVGWPPIDPDHKRKKPWNASSSCLGC